MTVKVLVVLNTADSQSVPFELASRMKRRGVTDVVLASYRDSYGGFPTESYGFPVTELGAKGVVSFGAIGRLYSLIRRENPDIVHLHLWPSGIWSVLLGMVIGKKLVKTEHNDVRFQGLGKRIVNCLLFPFLDRLVCNSVSTQNSLGKIEAAAIGKRGMVISNGVDFSHCDAHASARQAARSELGLGEEFVLGTVGRFVEQKNCLRLVSAFAKVNDKKIRLLLVGDGHLRSRIEAKIAELGLTDRVILTGAVSRDNVYRYLRAMDCFIVPSLWEGFCNAAVEAASTGLPLVASDIVTLNEVLGPNALYADPKDERAIAATIERMLNMAAVEREKLGANGAAFVRSRYDIDTASAAYEEDFLKFAAS